MKQKVSNTKVLKVALELFSSRGYAETKMVEIAGKAGLSVGALYLRFKNKEELCLEIIKDQTKDFYKRAEILAHTADTDALEALKQYIAFCFDCSVKKKQLLHIFYREYRLPFIKPLRNNFYMSQCKLIEEMLQKGVDNNVLRPLNTKDTAMTVFASIRGAIMLKVIYGVGSSEMLSSSLFDLISNGIRKGNA